MTRINGPVVVEASIDSLTEDWLESCRARGLSPKTIGNYEYTMKTVFAAYLKDQAITELAGVTQQVLDRMGSELLERQPWARKSTHLSKFTVANYLRPVNQFLEWCAAQGLENDARSQLPSPKRQHIEILSRAEIAQMEDAAQTERDKLIVRVLAECGLRVGELVKLDIGDIVDKGQYLQVMGKGSRVRVVPLPPSWNARLLRYAARGRVGATDEALFVSLRLNKVTGGRDRLTESAVQNLIHWLAKGAGIKRRVHPHLLRHTAITNFIAKGMNTYLLSSIVGNYGSLDTYVHLRPADARAAMIKALAE